MRLTESATNRILNGDTKRSLVYLVNAAVIEITLPFTGGADAVAAGEGVRLMIEAN